VWFKNRRAKCRQIQKAGEQQQQQQQQQVVKNSPSCAAATQLTNGSTVVVPATGLEPGGKQRAASACSSGDSGGPDSPVPVKFNMAAGTGNGCSRSPELDQASGDDSAPSVSPPPPPAAAVAGSYCQLPASPPSPLARSSCLGAAKWSSPIPRDAINGFGYRQPESVGPPRGGTSYGGMMGPNGGGFYGYGYGDAGGPAAASYGTYYGNGALDQWQWSTSMTRSYCVPPDHGGHLLGCGAAPQPGMARYDAVPPSYLPQTNVRQLAELTDDGELDHRKDWYRFHAL